MVSWVEEKWKALSFGTIVFTVILNGYLFIRTVRAAGGLGMIVRGPRGVRLSTLVSLMVGDILAALFPQVVRLSYLFTGTGSCRTVNHSTIYIMYLLPFVHATGLIVIAFEGVLFRLQNQMNSWPKLSVLASAVPWIVGVSVVLPMVVRDSDYQVCGLGHREGRVKLLLKRCQLWPVVASVSVTIVCLLVIWNEDRKSASEKYQDIYIEGHGLAPRVLGETETKQAQSPSTEVKSNLGEPLEEASLYLPVAFRMYSSAKSSKQQSTSTDHGKSVEGSTVDSQSQWTNPERSSVYSQRLSIVLNQTNGNTDQNMDSLGAQKLLTVITSSGTIISAVEGEYLPLPSLTPSTSSYLTKNEKIALLMATLAFAACDLPNPLINLLMPTSASSPGNLSYENRQALKDVGYWMLSVRSFVSPFVWLVTRNITGR